MQNSYNDMLWEQHRKILIVQKCKDIFDKFYYAKIWTNLVEAQEKERQTIRDQIIAMELEVEKWNKTQIEANKQKAKLAKQITKAYELKLEQIGNAYWKEYNAKEMKLRESETENQPHTFEELMEKIEEVECKDCTGHPKHTKFIKKGVRNQMSGKDLLQEVNKGVKSRFKNYKGDPKFKDFMKSGAKNTISGKDMLKGIKENLKDQLKSKMKRPPLQALAARSDQENVNPNQDPVNITLINDGGA